MDYLNFYKDLFEKELSRRTDIDNAINIPIAIITLLVGYLSYSYKIINIDLLYKNIIFGTLISLILVSIYFLSKSYNNFFKGFKYDNLPKTKELYKYQNEIKSFNREVKKKDKEDFDNYLLQNFVEMADKNKSINQIRLLNLYRGKTFLILSLTTSILVTLILIIKSSLL